MPGPARGPGMGRRGGPGGPHMGGRCGPGMGPRPSTPSAATVWQLISEALSPRRVSWMHDHADDSRRPGGGHPGSPAPLIHL